MTYSWAVVIFIAVPIAFGIAQALASLVPTRASEANRGLPRRQRPPAQGRAGEIDWWKATPTYKPAGTGASTRTAVARPGDPRSDQDRVSP